MYGHERSLVKKYSGRPFVLLGVNNDDEIDTVRKAIAKNNLNWRSFYDGARGPIVKDYGIRSFPTIFLVDHTGVIRYKNVRGEKLDDAIEELVSEAEAVGITGGSEPKAKLREFVDSTGEHTTVAAYLGYEEGAIQLETEDGEEIEVPWSRLSLADQRYVARQRLMADGRKKIADTPFEFDQPMEFTDDSGQHSIRGTYICLDQTVTIIWDTDGKEVRVPWRKLSKSTKDAIQGVQKNRRESL